MLAVREAEQYRVFQLVNPNFSHTHIEWHESSFVRSRRGAIRSAQYSSSGNAIVTFLLRHRDVASMMSRANSTQYQ
jgi:hypothetical protein